MRRPRAPATGAEPRLRDANLDLEATVDERTADLREANNEIQRFAYIVSHDLRSPLVSIMGFTSELEELGGDIFAASVASPTSPPTAAAPPAGEIALEGPDKQLSADFSEAIGFIKSLDRQDGSPDLGDPEPHPRGSPRIRAGAGSTPAS